MLAIIVPAAVLLIVYGSLALLAWRRPMLGRLAEALVTTTVGVAAGIGIGFAVAWAYVTASGIARPEVDMAQVLVPALLIYAAVVLVTIGPAVQASRMRTSEALRIVG
jgi:ABC-type antimicrobial peptide transport system permease subunit